MRSGLLRNHLQRFQAAFYPEILWRKEKKDEIPPYFFGSSDEFDPGLV